MATTITGATPHTGDYTRRRPPALDMKAGKFHSWNRESYEVEGTVTRGPAGPVDSGANTREKVAAYYRAVAPAVVANVTKNSMYFDDLSAIRVTPRSVSLAAANLERFRAAAKPPALRRPPLAPRKPAGNAPRSTAASRDRVDATAALVAFREASQKSRATSSSASSKPTAGRPADRFRLGRRGSGTSKLTMRPSNAFERRAAAVRTGKATPAKMTASSGPAIG